MREIQLKPHQFAWLKWVLCVWFLCMVLSAVVLVIMGKAWGAAGLVLLSGMGILYRAGVRNRICKIKKISECIEDFIRKNNLYQSHYAIRRTLFREKDVESIDYYPQITYVEIPCDNIFRLKFRLDGSPQAQHFRELEQPLSDRFYTICVANVEERGYITYCFELYEQKQAVIESAEDILPAGETEIAFSSWGN